MTNVLHAVLALSAMGCGMGIILALAAKLFAVRVDPRVEELQHVLPGANCGGCGYAGCAAFAQALVAGKAQADGCPVADPEEVERMSEILGVETQTAVRTTAMVQCSGGVRATCKYDYVGLTDCHAAMRIGGGAVECRYGCLGLGSCVSVCPFGAIAVVDGTAVIDHERCTGCMKCLSACPKGIIGLVPYHADVYVPCASHDKGAAVRKLCEIGCISCRLCEKACNHDAIHLVDNLAVIDYEKCVGCGDCAEKCPRKLILDAKLDRGPRLLAEDA